MLERLSWLKNADFFRPESARRLLWLALALAFSGVFLKVTWELYEDSHLSSLDQQILIFISHFRFSALNGPAVDATALGSPTVIALFTAIGVLLMWLKQDRRGCAYLVTGSIGAGLATFVMKHLFTRPRPDVVPRLVEVSGYSYPSGHSLAATSFYLLLMFLASRYFRSWFERAILAACTATVIGSVCFSRLYLGVHYPSDVLSGACLGAAWTCFLTAVFTTGGRGRG